jgi:hypothetical protein
MNEPEIMTDPNEMSLMPVDAASPAEDITIQAVQQGASASKLSFLSTFIAQQQARLSGLMQKTGDRVLLCESDGFVFRAWVVARDAQQLVVLHHAQTPQADPSSALASVVEQLTEQYEQALPQQALLVSSQAIPAMLELPVEKDHTMPKERMLEMVRWEMEALTTEQLTQWNIGWLLLAKGYLTEAQREEILNAMQVNADELANRGGRAPARFGEEAIRRDFVSREQLEECLTLQEDSYLLDDSIDCSWLTEPNNAGRQKGLWLSVAMSAALRQQWVASFTEQSMQLKWIYPQAGMSGLSLLLAQAHEAEPVAHVAPQVCVSIERGYVACMRIERQSISQIALRRCSDYALRCDDIVELCQGMMSTEIKVLWVDGDHWRCDELAEELSDTLGRPLAYVSAHQAHQFTSKLAPTDSLPGPAALAATQHYWELIPAHAAVQLRGSPPPPPIYKQSNFQLVAVGVFAMLLLLGTEIGFLIYHGNIHRNIDDIQARVRTVELNNEKLSANNSDMARLNTELSTWRTREKAVIARKKAIESVLIERQQFAENILGVIAERLPEEAVIYSIREIGWYEMEIQGWALSQSMVDRFNASLSRALDDWDMYIKDSPSEAKGLMGTDAFSGYAFTFSIEKQKS